MMRKHSTRLSQVHDEDPDFNELQRTADLDYPELGRILSERPDPGRMITVIGRRKTAAGSWDSPPAGPWHDRSDIGAPELHRGMLLDLPAEVHNYVHDASRPAAQRGLVLARHVLSVPHPRPERGAGVGFNWTTSPYRAKYNAEEGWNGEPGMLDTAGRTPVILHARWPTHEEIEHNQGILRDRDLVSYQRENESGTGRFSPAWDDYFRDPDNFPSQDTQEVSFRHGGHVPLTGISWAPPGHSFDPTGFARHDPRWEGEEDAAKDPAWSHLMFPEPVRARA